MLIPFQSGIHLVPHSGSGSGSGVIQPFDRKCARIRVQLGERVEGSVSADQQPIHFYLFHDMQLDHLDDYNPASAVEHEFGMTYRFDFVSDSDADWLVIYDNMNNLTQHVEYEYTAYPTTGEIIVQYAPTVIILSLPIVLLVAAIVLKARRKTSQNS